MKRFFLNILKSLVLIVLAGGTFPAYGQNVQIPADTAITTSHEVTIKGNRIPYTATVGNQPVWDEDGKPIATLLYTYYQRSDIKDRVKRPLVISFNGGPGSGSLWMHLGYTGPRHLKIDDEGYPIQPYGVEDNEHSILDVADIVYVNPVNTGYSRILDKSVDKSVFFGVNADVQYLAKWLNAFVTRHERWRSPKFLIGESYGTTRVSGLAGALQGRSWMYLNGVILVSPTELGIERQGPIDDALKLPYYTATAWYHKALAPDLQQKDLDDILPEVENYTIDELIPALTRGGFLSEAKREEVAEKVARYAGLSKQTVLDHNLRIPTSFFWKELLRDQGLTVGRLDSRYRGVDKKNAGDRYDFDPALTAWNHAFAPAVNYYMRSELNYKTDLQYWLFGPVHPWDRSNNNTGEALRRAMASNPYLHLLVQSGYYDGGTPFFDAKYSMWNMDPSGKLKDRMQWIGYRSGHMMYLRKDDIATSNEDIRKFIKASTPEWGTPAKY